LMDIELCWRGNLGRSKLNLMGKNCKMQINVFNF
jgi:hypothetical protein